MPQILIAALPIVEAVVSTIAEAGPAIAGIAETAGTAALDAAGAIGGAVSDVAGTVAGEAADLAGAIGGPTAEGAAPLGEAATPGAADLSTATATGTAPELAGENASATTGFLGTTSEKLQAAGLAAGLGGTAYQSASGAIAQGKASDTAAAQAKAQQEAVSQQKQQLADQRILAAATEQRDRQRTAQLMAASLAQGRQGTILSSPLGGTGGATVLGG